MRGREYLQSPVYAGIMSSIADVLGCLALEAEGAVRWLPARMRMQHSRCHGHRRIHTSQHRTCYHAVRAVQCWLRNSTV